MNKQRYIAELQRLLVFMTEEDRAVAVRRYADMFDEAGEDGADALVAKIGSPTKAAIALSRGYEPDSLAAVEPEAPPPPRRRETAPRERNVSWDEYMDYEMPDYMTGDGDYEPEAPAGGEEDYPRDYDGYDGAPDWETAPSEPWRSGEAAEKKERHMPLGLGIPLFVLIVAAVGIPLFLAAVAVMAVLLLPGAVGLLGAYLSAVGGLWCVSYIADAVFIFGVGFIILALGFILLWCGIWVDAKIIDLYAKGVQWLGGELLGRRVSEDE